MTNVSADQSFTIDSSLSPDAAFARVADLTRLGEWDRGVSGVSQISGEGPQLGARFSVTVKGLDGSPTELVYELVEFEPPKRFVMIGQNTEIRTHDTIDFAPANDDSSTVTYTATLELLADSPGVTSEQLDAVFAKVAAVAESGLLRFLNPED